MKSLNWNERSLRKALILAYPKYTPVKLINEAAFHLGAQTDWELARMLNFDGAQLWRVRHKKDVISDTLLICFMDATGWDLKKVRELAGLPSPAELRREIRIAMGEEKRKAA